MTKKKNFQLQFGITAKHVAIDIIVDNEGLHVHVDTLGDLREV